MKKIAIVPTLLTLGNAVCGFAAIAFLSKISYERLSPTQADSVYFVYAGWLILAAMVFDALDGYVARLSKAATNFGVQLDSLCDAISFGVAPALLILRMGPSPMSSNNLGLNVALIHQALAVVATLYMVCALLRLARFNVETTPDPEDHKRFKGLPSPAAAGCIATLGILCGPPNPASPELWRSVVFQQFSQPVLEQMALIVEWITPLAGLTAGLLMVSRVSYPHMTNRILRGRKRFGRLMQVILASFIFYLVREPALVLTFWGYALVFVGRWVWLRWQRPPHVPPAPTPAEQPPREPLKWPADVHRAN